MSPFFLSGLDAILRRIGNLTPTISLTDRIMLHVSQSNAIQNSFIHSASMLVLQFSAVVCIIARDSIRVIDVCGCIFWEVVFECTENCLYLEEISHQGWTFFSSQKFRGILFPYLLIRKFEKLSFLFVCLFLLLK